MKKILLLCSLLIWSAEIMIAQNVRKTYATTKPYTEVKAIGAFKIEYSDKYAKLTLVAPQSVAQYIKVETIRGEPILRIRYTKNKIELKGEPIPTLYVPRSVKLREVELDGLAVFNSEQPITVPHFEISADGAAKIDCVFDMPDGKLEVDADGASVLNMQGEVGTLELDLDGMSTLSSPRDNKQFSFRVHRAECDLSGTSVVKLHCYEYLEAECDGACVLHYTGTPITDINTSGMSKVKQVTRPL